MRYEIEIDDIPEGFVPIAFRPPKKGEYYRSCSKDRHPIEAGIDCEFNALILKKFNPKLMVLKFTGEIRPARRGDFYSHNGGYISQWSEQYSSSFAYEIWREVKE